MMFIRFDLIIGVRFLTASLQFREKSDLQPLINSLVRTVFIKSLEVLKSYKCCTVKYGLYKTTEKSRPDQTGYAQKEIVRHI